MKINSGRNKDSVNCWRQIKLRKKIIFIFVIFSPCTQFFDQFFSTQKCVNRDKTDSATKVRKLWQKSRKFAYTVTFSTSYTCQMWRNFRFFHIFHAEKSKYDSTYEEISDFSTIVSHTCQSFSSTNPISEIIDKYEVWLVVYCTLCITSLALPSQYLFVLVLQIQSEFYKYQKKIQISTDGETSWLA